MLNSEQTRQDLGDIDDAGLIDVDSPGGPLDHRLFLWFRNPKENHRKTLRKTLRKTIGKTIGKWWFHGMFNGIYPSVILEMVVFHSYFKLPEGNGDFHINYDWLVVWNMFSPHTVVGLVHNPN